MASKPTNTTDHSSHHSPSSTTPPPHSTLPQKPITQKRTRNSTSTNLPPTTRLPPTAHPTNPARPRRSWSRRSASWTPDEDTKLIQLVQQETSVPPSITASKTWSRVAAQLNNRTGKQCRERYLNQLKPGIRRDPWSPEEERILQHSHARYGNKWVTIASHLPGRTDNCVKNHWNSMLRKRQRREAARRAAEQPNSSALPPVIPLPADLPHQSNLHSSQFHPRPTLSGASSSDQDVPSASPVPSPLTASSPITPKRHVKLRISSLVAASSKESPAWDPTPFTRHDSSVTQSPSNLSLASAQAPVLSFPVTHQSILPSAHHHITPNSLSTSTSAANPQAVMSSPLPTSKHKNMNSPSAQTDDVLTGTETNCFHRQLRRSARLTSSLHDRSKNEAAMWKSKPNGIKKRPVSNTRRQSNRAGNPLAALAAAASSVPPSPLTPESRFSGTSRSRSVSPSPRAIPDLAKNNAGSSAVVAVTLTKNMSKDSTGFAGSCKADHVKNSNTTNVKD